MKTKQQERRSIPVKNKLDEIIDDIYDTIKSSSKFESLDWLFDDAEDEIKEYIKELGINDNEEITASYIWCLFDRKYDYISCFRQIAGWQ